MPDFANGMSKSVPIVPMCFFCVLDYASKGLKSITPLLLEHTVHQNIIITSNSIESVKRISFLLNPSVHMPTLATLYETVLS